MVEKRVKIRIACYVLVPFIGLGVLYLHGLALRNRYELIDALLGGPYANPVEDAKKIKNIIRGGADPNTTSEDGYTPLMLAGCALVAPQDREEIVRLLLEHGADVNKVANSGDTALHLLATSAPSPSIVKMLLEADADVDARDGHGMTPLITVVAITKNYDVTRLLLASGAAVDQRDSAGRTAIYFAAWRGRMDLVTLLLEHGADPSIADIKGIAPLERAVEANHTEIAGLLRARTDSEQKP